jgi:hypothetical protein
MENARLHEKPAFGDAEMGKARRCRFSLPRFSRQDSLRNYWIVRDCLGFCRWCSKRLTLIRAPAGFGKTVAWVERLREMESKVAWVGPDDDVALDLYSSTLNCGCAAFRLSWLAYAQRPRSITRTPSTSSRASSHARRDTARRTSSRPACQSCRTVVLENS